MLLVLLAMAPLLVYAGPSQSDTLNPDCVMHLMQSADDHLTVGEIRQRCAETITAHSFEGAKPDSDDDADTHGTLAAPADAEQLTALTERLETDRKAADRAFSIMAHRPNYILAAAYNTEGWDPTPFREASGNPEYVNKDVEAQFQISVKVPLALDLFDGRADLYAAYTNRSFWQVYSATNSQPFRETNHEPEFWLQFANDWQFAGFTNSVNAVGYLHQSNGRGAVLSRSWDRLYANFIFQKGNVAIGIMPWWWINADKSESSNPDIDDYMGYGEMKLVWERKRHVVAVMLRNHIESGFERGATEISWSFPIFGYSYLRGYLQYFYGYGESLIDYNQKANRLGIGISVTDWFN